MPLLAVIARRNPTCLRPPGLRSTVSRPFHKPESGTIAVKVINHNGDEVLKVFSVGTAAQK